MYGMQDYVEELRIELDKANKKAGNNEELYSRLRKANKKIKALEKKLAEDSLSAILLNVPDEELSKKDLKGDFNAVARAIFFFEGHREHQSRFMTKIKDLVESLDAIGVQVRKFCIRYEPVEVGSGYGKYSDLAPTLYGEIKNKYVTLGALHPDCCLIHSLDYIMDNLGVKA